MDTNMNNYYPSTQFMNPPAQPMYYQPVGGYPAQQQERIPLYGSNGQPIGTVTTTPDSYQVPPFMMNNQPTQQNTTQPGYNPFFGYNPQPNPMQPNYNPGYQNPYNNQNYYLNPPMVNSNGYTYQNPYTYFYGGYSMYGSGASFMNNLQAQLDAELWAQNISDRSDFDFDDFSKIVFTDRELEQMEKKRQAYNGVDYYGRPIYNNEYLMDQQKEYNDAVQDARKQYTDLYTLLAKGVTFYTTGKDMTDEEIQEYQASIDPLHGSNTFIKNQQDLMVAMNNNQPVQGVMVGGQQALYGNSVPQKKEMTEDDKRVAKLTEAGAYWQHWSQAFDMAQNMMNQKFRETCKRIRASHDRLLGIPEGVDRNSVKLDFYLNHASNLYIDSIMSEQRHQVKLDKYKRWDQDQYNARLMDNVSIGTLLNSNFNVSVNNALSAREQIAGMTDQERADLLKASDDFIRAINHDNEAVTGSDLGIHFGNDGTIMLNGAESLANYQRRRAERLANGNPYKADQILSKQVEDSFEASNDESVMHSMVTSSANSSGG